MIVLWHQSGVVITIIYNLLLLWTILETRSLKHHVQQYLQLPFTYTMVVCVCDCQLCISFFFFLIILFKCFFGIRHTVCVNTSITSLLVQSTNLFGFKSTRYQRASTQVFLSGRKGPSSEWTLLPLFTKSMHTHAHALSQRCNCFNEEIHQRAKRALQHKLLMWRQTSLL